MPFFLLNHQYFVVVFLFFFCVLKHLDVVSMSADMSKMVAYVFKMVASANIMRMQLSSPGDVVWYFLCEVWRTVSYEVSFLTEIEILCVPHCVVFFPSVIALRFIS